MASLQCNNMKTCLGHQNNDIIGTKLRFHENNTDITTQQNFTTRENSDTEKMSPGKVRLRFCSIKFMSDNFQSHWNSTSISSLRLNNERVLKYILTAVLLRGLCIPNLLNFTSNDNDTGFISGETIKQDCLWV